MTDQTDLGDQYISYLHGDTIAAAARRDKGLPLMNNQAKLLKGMNQRMFDDRGLSAHAKQALHKFYNGDRNGGLEDMINDPDFEKAAGGQDSLLKALQPITAVHIPDFAHAPGNSSLIGIVPKDPRAYYIQNPQGPFPARINPFGPPPSKPIPVKVAPGGGVPSTYRGKGHTLMKQDPKPGVPRLPTNTGEASASAPPSSLVNAPSPAHPIPEKAAVPTKVPIAAAQQSLATAQVSEKATIQAKQTYENTVKQSKKQKTKVQAIPVTQEVTVKSPEELAREQRIADNIAKLKARQSPIEIRGGRRVAHTTKSKVPVVSEPVPTPVESVSRPIHNPPVKISKAPEDARIKVPVADESTTISEAELREILKEHKANKQRLTNLSETFQVGATSDLKKIKQRLSDNLRISIKDLDASFEPIFDEIGKKHRVHIGSYEEAIQASRQENHILQKTLKSKIDKYDSDIINLHNEYKKKIQALEEHTKTQASSPLFFDRSNDQEYKQLQDDKLSLEKSFAELNQRLQDLSATKEKVLQQRQAIPVDDQEGRQNYQSEELEQHTRHYKEAEAILSRKHVNEIVRLKREHEELVNRIKAEHTSTIAQKDKDLERRKVEIQAERDSSTSARHNLNQLTREKAEEIDKIRAEHLSNIAAVRGEHTREISTLQQKHEGELAARIRAHEGEKAEQSNQYQQQLASITLAHNKVLEDRDIQAKVINRLRDENESVVSAHARERAKFYNDIERLKKEHTVAVERAKATTVSEYNALMTKDTEYFTSELEDLRRVRNETYQQLNDLEDRHTNLSAEHAEAKARLQSAYNDFNTLLQQHNSLYAQHTELQTHLAQENYSGKIAELESKLQAKESEIVTRESQLHAEILSERLRELETKYTQEQQEVEKHLTRQITALQQTVDELTADHSAISNQLFQSQQALETYREQNATLSQSWQQVSQELEEALKFSNKEDLLHSQRLIQEQYAQINQQSNHILLQNAQVEQIAQQYEAQVGKVRSLEEHLTTVDNERQELQNRIDAILQEHDVVKQNLNAAHGETLKHIALSREQAANISQLKAALDEEHHRGYQEAEERYKELYEPQVSQLRERLDQIIQVKDDVEKAMTTERNSLQAETQRLQKIIELGNETVQQYVAQNTELESTIAELRQKQVRVVTVRKQKASVEEDPRQESAEDVDEDSGILPRLRNVASTSFEAAKTGAANLGSFLAGIRNAGNNLKQRDLADEARKALDRTASAHVQQYPGDPVSAIRNYTSTVTQPVVQAVNVQPVDKAIEKVKSVKPKKISKQDQALIDQNVQEGKVIDTKREIKAPEYLKNTPEFQARPFTHRTRAQLDRLREYNTSRLAQEAKVADTLSTSYDTYVRTKERNRKRAAIRRDMLAQQRLDNFLATPDKVILRSSQSALDQIAAIDDTVHRATHDESIPEDIQINLITKLVDIRATVQSRMEEEATVPTNLFEVSEHDQSPLDEETNASNRNAALIPEIDDTLLTLLKDLNLVSDEQHQERVSLPARVKDHAIKFYAEVAKPDVPILKQADIDKIREAVSTAAASEPATLSASKRFDRIDQKVNSGLARLLDLSDSSAGSQSSDPSAGVTAPSGGQPRRGKKTASVEPAASPILSTGDVALKKTEDGVIRLTPLPPDPIEAAKERALKQAELDNKESEALSTSTTKRSKAEIEKPRDPIDDLATLRLEDQRAKNKQKTDIEIQSIRAQLNRHQSLFDSPDADASASDLSDKLTLAKTIHHAARFDYNLNPFSGAADAGIYNTV